MTKTENMSNNHIFYLYHYCHFRGSTGGRGGRVGGVDRFVTLVPLSDCVIPNKEEDPIYFIDFYARMHVRVACMYGGSQSNSHAPTH